MSFILLVQHVESCPVTLQEMYCCFVRCVALCHPLLCDKQTVWVFIKGKVLYLVYRPILIEHDAPGKLRSSMGVLDQIYENT